MSDYENMLEGLRANKSISWTKFFKFDEVLELNHWVAGGHENQWQTTLENISGDLAKQNGCEIREGAKED
jgi:antibiotic biosynthesis monooxygenase (ABM) superfamily enzyme|tara:strand:+ start:545 stop:754 length:210 start_codon:yes stop_codon:yes gene_type:complete